MTAALEWLGHILRSPALKFFLILFLVLLLGTPLLFALFLVEERQGRAGAVQNEVSTVWGGPQRISGPFLILPYTVKVESLSAQGARVQQTEERRAVFLPETLNIGGTVRTEVLHRSIFDVNVYTAEFTLEGRFPAPDIAAVEPDPAAEVRWRDALIVLGVSSVSGFKEVAALRVTAAAGSAGSEELPFAPSLGVPHGTGSGIHVRLGGARSVFPASGGAPLPFSFQTELVLSGTSGLTFAPAARDTRAAVSADWPHPSFSGAFLPVERSIGPKSFTASWRVPHLARSVPDAWRSTDSSEDRLAPYAFGVTFYNPVEFYDLVSRAAKYALMFISFAFLAVFVMELLSGRRVHAVQYLFTGIAMVFFYVLLLSLAEHTGFLAAYLAAAGATGGMLSVYVGAVLASRVRGLIMLAVFAMLYGILYLILRLEDYALLAGALLGFAGLTLVMFLTLRVNWSGGGLPEPRN